MNRKIREIMSARENGESGFTLIELLVVIIIIGILASIAIPIFMNQQKTARDAATISDVKNVATNVQSALVRYPDADYFSITGELATMGDTEGKTFISETGKAKIWVGGASSMNQVSYVISLSKGTVISMSGQDGVFIVRGANPNGKLYTDVTPGKSFNYDSASRGIK